MKKLCTLLSFLFFVVISNNAGAANPLLETNSQNLFHGSMYKAGSVIIKIKPQFRSSCTNNEINISKLQNVLNQISASGLNKKFPRASRPAEKFNRLGYKLVDLTLIYEVQYSVVVKIEEAIRLMQATGLVEYAEPNYINKCDFTPNDPSLGAQYQIARISAEAAWDVCKGDSNVVIGIVDSGTDWDHPDLIGNIKYNYADPIDNIDNDSDGFIDNFRGWDVSETDNDPMVGIEWHGSHVSGCAAATTNNSIGVAAPAFNCKFLPVKSTHDASAFIDDGFDGIVYAADHGCDVINCSWGRTGQPSQLEQDAVNYAVINKDALVVAAAGNNGLDELHYPSAYENVISVAATNSIDKKAGFSNFSTTVDVSAPGNAILSTYYDDVYSNQNGTSMASPIAAGCAAMIKAKFPTFNAFQLGQQLKNTCDNINNVNPAYLNKLGTGRVNLFKAVTDSTTPGVGVEKVNQFDGNDNVFVVNDTINIVGIFRNFLRPTVNLSCSLITTSTDVQIVQANFTPGVVNTLDSISNYATPYRVAINPSAPLNTDVPFEILLSDGAWSAHYYFNIVVNVDYINIQINNVATSITSKSMIGYNQMSQQQGLGFRYMGSASILYDMELMVGAQGTQVSDNARAAGTNDADFMSVVNVSSIEPGIISDFDVSGVFNDLSPTSGNPLRIEVSHHAYAWTAAPNDNYVMVQYYIKNNGTGTLNSLYAGLFADWDVPAYANNKCSTDNGRRMGYIWSTDAGGLYGGIKLLSHTGGFNHYALDNNAGTSGILMTDSFANAEKYTALSTSRADAGTATTAGNDVLSVVSSGAFNLAVGDSIEVAFALIAGEDLASIQTSADAAQTKYNQIFVGIEPIGKANKNELLQSYPNPADNNITIDFSLKENSFAELSFYNLMGEKVKSVFAEKMTSGRYSYPVDVSNLSSGNYFYRLSSENFNQTMPLTIIHR